MELSQFLGHPQFTSSCLSVLNRILGERKKATKDGGRLKRSAYDTLLEKQMMLSELNGNTDEYKLKVVNNISENFLMICNKSCPLCHTERELISRVIQETYKIIIEYERRQENKAKSQAKKEAKSKPRRVKKPVEQVVKDTAKEGLEPVNTSE